MITQALTRISSKTRHGLTKSVLSVVLGGAYIAAWSGGGATLRGAPSDLDLYFWPSAEIAAHGHPLLIYSLSPLSNYPTANGPVGVLLVALVAAIANALGWAADPVRRGLLIGALAGALSLGLALTATSVISVAGRSGRTRVTVLFSVLLAVPLLVSAGAYGHVEQPAELAAMLGAVSLALRGRTASAGVAAGLAVLTRSTAVLYLAALVVAELSMNRRRPILPFAATVAVTVAIGTIPFLIADPSHVAYSLFSYRGGLPIAGGSIWVVAYHSPLERLIETGDLYLVLAVAVLPALIVAVMRSRGPMSAGTVLGLLTIAAASFPMLAKTTYPYYFLEPCVFATCWWLASGKTALNWRLGVPLLLIAVTLMAKTTVSLPLSGLGSLEGVVSSALMAVIVVIVFVDVFHSARSPARNAVERGGVLLITNG